MLWTNAWSRIRTRDDGQARSTEGTLVSELGWPSGALKRVANGLGWPKGDSKPPMVSRETVHPEPEVPATREDRSASGDAPVAGDSLDERPEVRPGEGGQPDPQHLAEANDSASGTTPAMNPASRPGAGTLPGAPVPTAGQQPAEQGATKHDPIEPVPIEPASIEHDATQQDPAQHDPTEQDPTEPDPARHDPIKQAAIEQDPRTERDRSPETRDPLSSSDQHQRTTSTDAPTPITDDQQLSRPGRSDSREPVSMLQATSPVAPDPLVDADLGSLADTDPLPDRQYATADAFGSRADADPRVFSSGLPEVRMSTSNDSPSTETETPAISVSVTRPWLEIDPAPGFRHVPQRPDEQADAAPAPAPASTGSHPLIESISLMDDSTPLALEVAEDTRRRIELAGRRFPRPKDTRVITVSNQKGGVGKTTTTVNMAAALAQAGLRVLVLDIDPQGNASTALGIDHHGDVPSIYDVLVEGRPLHEVVQQCPDVENLWCAPATVDLAGAEIELVSLVARESRLQRALSTYLGAQTKGLDRLDYILVDCPPSLGLLTVNAFVAAHEVLIPIQCEYYALEGLSQLLRNVELIRGHLNPTLHVSTILLTMYDGRTRLSSQVADEVRSHFPSEVLKTTVPRSVRISEAPSHGQTVMTYDPASSGALSYLEAARELAEQVLDSNSDADMPAGDRV
jgi:chromosome partitioning protein